MSAVIMLKLRRVCTRQTASQIQCISGALVFSPRLSLSPHNSGRRGPQPANVAACLLQPQAFASLCCPASVTRPFSSSSVRPTAPPSAPSSSSSLPTPPLCSSDSLDAVEEVLPASDHLRWGPAASGNHPAQPHSPPPPTRSAPLPAASRFLQWHAAAPPDAATEGTGAALQTPAAASRSVHLPPLPSAVRPPETGGATGAPSSARAAASVSGAGGAASTRAPQRRSAEHAAQQPLPVEAPPEEGAWQAEDAAAWAVSPIDEVLPCVAAFGASRLAGEGLGATLSAAGAVSSAACRPHATLSDLIAWDGGGGTGPMAGRGAAGTASSLLTLPVSGGGKQRSFHSAVAAVGPRLGARRRGGEPGAAARTGGGAGGMQEEVHGMREGSAEARSSRDNARGVEEGTAEAGSSSLTPPGAPRGGASTAASFVPTPHLEAGAGGIDRQLEALQGGTGGRAGGGSGMLGSRSGEAHAAHWIDDVDGQGEVVCAPPAASLEGAAKEREMRGAEGGPGGGGVRGPPGGGPMLRSATRGTGPAQAAEGPQAGQTRRMSGQARGQEGGGRVEAQGGPASVKGAAGAAAVSPAETVRAAARAEGGDPDSGGPAAAAAELRPVGEGEGTAVWALGMKVEVKAQEEVTGGAYSVVEYHVAPGAGSDAHAHTFEHEAWVVTEGRLQWRLEGREFTAHPGTFMHMPLGREHSFHNASGQPARMLAVCVPGGLEKFFLEVGAPAGGEEASLKPETTAEDARRATEVGRRYGLRFPPVEGALAGGVGRDAGAEETVVGGEQSGG